MDIEKKPIYATISFRNKNFSLYWEDGVAFNPICCYEFDCTENEFMQLIEDACSEEPRKYILSSTKLHIETLSLEMWIEIDEWAKQI